MINLLVPDYVECQMMKATNPKIIQVFREVVPVKRTELRVKIHQTYRMGYLKDVILPRSLDDGTFATLSSLMLFNNIEVFNFVLLSNVE